MDIWFSSFFCLALCSFRFLSKKLSVIRPVAVEYTAYATGATSTLPTHYEYHYVDGLTELPALRNTSKNPFTREAQQKIADVLGIKSS